MAGCLVQALAIAYIVGAMHASPGFACIDDVVVSRLMRAGTPALPVKPEQSYTNYGRGAPSVRLGTGEIASSATAYQMPAGMRRSL